MRKNEMIEMNNLYIKTIILAVIASGSIKAQVIKPTPKLVVNIVVDQLRSDYMEAFSSLYGDKGFKLLLKNGKVYTAASYDFKPVDRASATASIMTGSTPYYNGIVGEEWLDRETLRKVRCDEDKRYPGFFTSDAVSPKYLSVSTLGDELKVATGGKALVYSVSPFRDAAVITAGHSADGVMWIDDNNGKWCTSSYYYKKSPSWLKLYNETESPEVKLETVKWQPLSALSGSHSYFMNDNSSGRFTHKFTGDDRFREFKTSALVNDVVEDMAESCIKNSALGFDDVTDLLSVTFYAGKFKNDSKNNNIRELQDTYVRLDGTISKLISKVNNIVGNEHVMYVLTGTGYIDEEETEAQEYGIPSGTFYINRTANFLSLYFGAKYGKGRYVEAYHNNHIYLNRKLFEQSKIDFNEALDKAKDFLMISEGVKDVVTGKQILANAIFGGKEIRNGYNPARSGDIMVEVAPGWKIYNEDTFETHISRASFVPFPMIIYGCGVTPGVVEEPVSVSYLAPTVARAIKIRAPNACAYEPLF